MTATASEVRLADCVDLVAGFAFKSDRFEDASGSGVPLVKGENVGQGRILWDIARYWPAKEASGLDKFRLQAGDVVLAMDRPWVPAGLKWAVIREKDPAALLVQRCARLRTRTSRLRQDFLRFVIGGPGFEGYIRPITTGVNVPHISGAQILAYGFRLPPVEEQQRIAGILSAYDDLIENCERRIRVLDEMARSLYREWFVDRAPSSWRRMPLVDVVEINPKVKVPKDQAVTFVPMSGLGTQGMLIHEVETRTAPSGARFQNGDTLFARITPCLENGKTGFVNFLPTAESGACGSTEFIVMRGSRVPPEFVYCLARSDDLRAHAIKSMSGATGRQRVQEACFDTFMVALPPADALDHFVAIVRPSFDLAHRLGERVKNLRATRDLLLPRLLSGQLSVDDAA